MFKTNVRIGTTDEPLVSFGGKQVNHQHCLKNLPAVTSLRMLEFVELKVLLRAKEVKMYFIYVHGVGFRS